jgi:hypothetical protein
MKVNRIVMFLSAAALFGFATAATAGDHLACYKVKDNVSGSPLKNKYSAVLPSNIGLPVEQGCTIATPAKLCCAPVDKVGTAPNPPPPDTFLRPAANKFCCYKTKCAKPLVAPTAGFSDQFADRTLTLAKVGYVCAPASPSGAFVDNADLF